MSIVATLDDDNVHVKELNRLFLGCANEGENYLDEDGLHTLCAKLNLTPFADAIVERVLCGYRVVDFQAFKDRFVQLLPEIIDVSTSSETLERNCETTLNNLGINNGHLALTRYKTRLLCENTSELNRLSVVDINTLFDRADTSGIGEITLSAFISQYYLFKKINKSNPTDIDFINDSFVSSVNLTIDSQGLLEHWASCGISIEQGLTVLKRQLSEFATTQTASTVVRVALLSLHAFIDHLRLVINVSWKLIYHRCMVREGECRAEHLHKQLQLANQRRTLLIEELENNQLSIEEGYEQRIRETEERYRTRVSQMEDRFRVEKKELMNELTQAEEELSRVRQSECASRNRLQLVERQCERLNDETRELSETIQQIEELNRKLKIELNKNIISKRNFNDDRIPNVMWKNRVELLLAHNKRLRDKVDELMNSDRKKHLSIRGVDPLYMRWTSAFRSQLIAIRKRRMARINNDTLSEMESEPESIFVRSRKRRLLKIRERKRRHERVAHPIGSSSSSNDTTTAGVNGSGALKENNTHLQLLQKTLTEKELKSLLGSSSSTTAAASASIDCTNRKVMKVMMQNDECEQIRRIKDEEISKLKEEHRKEIIALKLSTNKSLADALNDQQRQITQSFEKERRQFEIKLASERNSLERKFAEEKMKLISRLQQEFEQELARLRAPPPPLSVASASDDSRNYKRQIEQLESSLRGQRNGYEKKLAELKEKYRIELNLFRSLLKPTDSSPSSFIALIEKYRNSDVLPTSTRRFLDIEEKMERKEDAGVNLLNVEKAKTKQLATFSLPMSDSKLATISSSSSVSVSKQQSSNKSRCERCELVDSKLKSVYSALTEDNAVQRIESGIEDVGSSADSLIEEKALLKNENQKLKGRLELAKERLTELRLFLSLNGGASSKQFSNHHQNLDNTDEANHSNPSSATTTATVQADQITELFSSSSPHPSYFASCSSCAASAISQHHNKQQPTSYRYYRYHAGLGGSENSELRFSRREQRTRIMRASRRHCERLQMDNAILNARLIESRQLMKTIVASYGRQLDETSRLGKLLQLIYTSPSPSLKSLDKA
ncbi:unnamed protein product [Anisakis simplex]|uniref:LisH domain-containing protein n=1 Tax=Anisakis simplex TaxID=6269 RepID=A0A0M3JUB3_ANISI|nr:unnamed protein product [Anisakis simplex]